MRTLVLGILASLTLAACITDDADSPDEQHVSEDDSAVDDKLQDEPPLAPIEADESSIIDHDRPIPDHPLERQ